MIHLSKQTKAFIMASAMVVILLLPMTTTAQSSMDGFFANAASETCDFRAGSNSLDELINASNQQFGENESPLGSGLVIMIMAGIVYVALRKRKSVTALLLMVIILSFTQCKKNTAVIDTADHKTIDITINVAGDSKINVNTTTGTVTFERYDELHIVSNGKYLGSVVKDSDDGGFTGSIEQPEENMPLYVYYLGVHNKHYNTITAGSTKCSVDITDQTNKLPVISCGITDYYTSTTSSYDVKLLNKCALVKFNVKTSSENEATCLKGLNNEMIIDFSLNTFTPDTVGESMIKLPKGSGERWAILLPNSTPESSKGTAFSADFSYIGTRDAMDAIHNNDFITTGYNVDINMTTASNTSVDDKKFSLSDTKRVLFARGNVQHVRIGDKWVWRFAENQYDVLTNENVQKYSGECDRDRFGWGTGGNEVTYGAYPDNLSFRNSDYPQSTEQYVDWGVNIVEDKDCSWFAPKCIEWKYLMFHRPATKINDVYNARYARARVNGVNGIILFPDVYNHPDGVALPVKSSINYTNNNNGTTYANNDYSVADWMAMQDAGAVFLPCTGQRIQGSDDQYGNHQWTFDEVGTSGHYWSQCDLGDNNFACNMFFTDYRVYVRDKNDKCKGFAVRLVHE